MALPSVFASVTVCGAALPLAGLNVTASKTGHPLHELELLELREDELELLETELDELDELLKLVLISELDDDELRLDDDELELVPCMAGKAAVVPAGTTKSASTR